MRRKKPKPPERPYNFIIIPDRAMELPPAELKVLMCLVAHQNKDNQCWPSIPMIQFRCQIKDKYTVGQALKKLEEHEWIKKVKVGRKYFFTTTLEIGWKNHPIHHKNRVEKPPNNGGKNPPLTRFKELDPSSSVPPKTQKDDLTEPVLAKFLTIIQALEFPGAGLNRESHKGIDLPSTIVRKAERILTPVTPITRENYLRWTSTLIPYYSQLKDPWPLSNGYSSQRKNSLTTFLDDFANQMRLARDIEQGLDSLIAQEKIIDMPSF